MISTLGQALVWGGLLFAVFGAVVGLGGGLLRREAAYQARREDQRLALAEKQRWKKIHLAARQRMRG